jgi:23S rRNA (adenine2503-C2)-methyltransferase
MTKTDIKSMTLAELEKFTVETLGEKKFRAKQIYEWLHVRLADSFDEMTNLSKALRKKLSDECFLTHLEIVEKYVSAIDGTAKYLFRLSDGSIIESVLMHYKHGNSVCISSQVGCRMGCRFCASTLGGLERQMLASEMLDEIYQIQKESGERVSNVVVMGTGEPLDNYDALVRMIELLTNPLGLNISQRNMTVSTCGIVPKIYELADLDLQITLAISLHAVNDEKRRELMPIANTYSIAQVLEACRYYYSQNNRRITFEYSLVKDVNDSREEAKALAELLAGMNCHINLIPVNPIEERDYRQTEAQAVLRFKNLLEKYGRNVTIRREMGRDIQAACGQLRKKYMEQSMDGEG